MSFDKSLSNPRGYDS